MKATADLGNTNVTSTVLATRGERLILTSAGFSDIDQGPEAFRTEVLSVSEILTDNRLSALVLFDREDIDAAFTELDSRYLRGQASAHAHAWSVLTGAYRSINRHEDPLRRQAGLISTTVGRHHLRPANCWHTSMRLGNFRRRSATASRLCID